MTQQTSSIPAVTDAILALLVAQSWPGARPKIRDSDWDPADGAETVTVGDTFREGEADQVWAAFTMVRHETYALNLTIRAAEAKLEAKKARDRAFALLAVVETALRSTQYFGFDTGGLDISNVQLLNAEIRQPIHAIVADGDGGVVCVIDSAIRVTIRLA